MPGTSAAACTGAGRPKPSESRATGQSTPSGADDGGGTAPFKAIVGLSSGRAGTADRSYPHAPQKRSPDSRGSSQLGHLDTAACWGICDINYTHVRGR
ncbi:hypothetical protein GCM10010385_27670 [Streptomyces geysiriensis]|nr:hypothetical protein GCM10010385_27670 [Streptomyces geysiriensis]